MTARRPLAVGWAWLAGAGVVLAMADDPIRVTPVVADGAVSVSFAAPTVFSDDTRAVVQTGLPVTFTYTIELKRPSFFIDDTLVRATVSSAVKLDTLTGFYQVSKSHGDRVVWSERSQDEAQVRLWMTTFDNVRVQPALPLEANADYYVRVRLHASPRRTFSLWPFGRDDGSGRGDFTVIR